MKKKFDGRIMIGVVTAMGTVGVGVVKLFKGDTDIDWTFWTMATGFVVVVACGVWMLQRTAMKREAERLSERRGLRRTGAASTEAESATD